jgi:hypothetical protein
MALLFSLAAVAATFTSSVSAAATSGDFNILSFNVAGLPAILNDNAVPGDKATNAGTIGSLFAKYDYDVIHVQEDMYPLSIFESRDRTITDLFRTLQLSRLYLRHR